MKIRLKKDLKKELIKKGSEGVVMGISVRDDIDYYLVKFVENNSFILVEKELTEVVNY